MKYIFFMPDFLAKFHFCNHNGEGFSLGTRLEDALVSADADSAAIEIERLTRKSGRLVEAREVAVTQ